MDRNTKLRRPDAFRRRLPYVSHSGIAKMIDDIKRHGIPELHTREDIRAARRLVSSQRTPYGPIQQHLNVGLTKGGVAAIPFARPQAMLWTAVKQGGGFSNRMAQMLAANPPTPDYPWQLVMYSDEIIPGNRLGHQNERKSWNVYWSLLELGIEYLCDENAWFLELCVRSSNVNLCQAGMSTS